jgi:hypothetical protein
MSETHAKRARAHSKVQKRKDKEEKKKQRREQEPGPELPPGVLEAQYYGLDTLPEDRDRS